MSPTVIRDIVYGEIDRSISCSHWWGKMDTCDALDELRKRIQYRIEQEEKKAEEESEAEKK